MSSSEVLDPVPERSEELLSLSLLLNAFWLGRRIFFASIGTTLLLAGLYLSFLSQPVYQARAVVSPSVSVSGGSNVSGNLSNLSGLSSIIGLGGGSSPSSEFDKFMQVMTSARLAADLETRFGFLHQMSENWDEENKRWKQPSDIKSLLRYGIGRMLGQPRWTQPGPSDFARQLVAIVKVDAAADTSSSSRTGGATIRVTLNYRSPQVAAQMLNEFLKDADDLVRQDRATNNTNRVVYLTAQLGHTTDLTLRENLQNLLLQEQQSLMVLHADKFYSFDMVDPPTVDTSPIAPRPFMMLLEALALGGLFAAIYIFVLLWSRIKGQSIDVEAILGDGFPGPIAMFMAWSRR